VAEILERRTLKGGDTVFREGEQGSSAFVVQSGEVVITKLIDGEENELATIGVGGIFGEMALIDEQPRMATARGTSWRRTSPRIMPSCARTFVDMGIVRSRGAGAGTTIIRSAPWLATWSR
jgi:hypothetical protein